eukprot:scaffold7837_cov89-Isochrysis_galbana.AAC.5
MRWGGLYSAQRQRNHVAMKRYGTFLAFRFRKWAHGCVSLEHTIDPNTRHIWPGVKPWGCEVDGARPLLPSLTPSPPFHPPRPPSLPPQVLAYHEKKYKAFRRMTDDQLEYRRIMQ